MTPQTAAARSDSQDVSNWRPTKAEWISFVENELARLGVTRQELERQAHDRDFQSPDAQALWMMIG